MKYFLITTMLLHAFGNLAAQHTGLIFNKQAYRHLADSSMKAQNRSSKMEVNKKLPNHLSLKEYCSKAGDQPNASCAAWSVCHGVLSIDRTVRRKQHKSETFSPAYVYKQVASSDTSGASVDTVLKFIQANGACRAMTFCSNHRFEQQPNHRAKEEATYFGITGFKALYHADSSKAANLRSLKRHLAEKKAIILCLNTDTLLTNAFKHPTPIMPNTAHALCLIGYDDRNRDSIFELFNSWGEDWGDKGFLRVKQSDLLNPERILGAYGLNLDSKLEPNEIALFQKGKSADIEMKFNNNAPFLKYAAKKTDFLKEQPLLLHLNALRDSQRAYIFSQNTQHQWQLDSVLAEEVDHSMELTFDKSGKDDIYVLFSDKPLDWSIHLPALQTAQGQPFEQLQMVFKDFLDDNAKYYSYRPSVRFAPNKIAIVGIELNAE